MERTARSQSAEGPSPTILVALMLVRPAIVLLAQAALFALLGPSETTLRWWPFQVITANILCFIVLLALAKREGRPVRRLYFRPFDEGLALGRFSAIFAERHWPNRLYNRLYDLGLFILVLGTLGLAALLISGWIDGLLQRYAPISRYGDLPTWAIASVTLLLPLSMPLVEVPWYFGYFFPKLEGVLARHGSRSATLQAFALTTGVFCLQHCVQPFVPNASYLVLRFLVELPIIALAAWVIRFAPRLTPYFLALHGLMAIEAASKYWRFL